MSGTQRRSELSHSRLESAQQREEYWVIADLVGEGGHVRTVPVPRWVKAFVNTLDDGRRRHPWRGVPSDQ
jgi:hypothetical protein